jgi:hypothetical protein
VAPPRAPAAVPDGPLLPRRLRPSLPHRRCRPCPRPASARTARRRKPAPMSPCPSASPCSTRTAAIWPAARWMLIRWESRWRAGRSR